MYRAEFSTFIKEDIKEIHAYIKDTLEAPRAADKLRDDLLERIEYIKMNPYARPLVQDKFLAYLGLRSIKVNNYLLFYIVKENKDKSKSYINILRFMYGRRDWANIIKNESINEIL